MKKQTGNISKSDSTTLTQDLIALGRYYLAEKRGMYIVGASIAIVGIFSGWGWLTAMGLAPILLALLPCAAMCALGLCMRSPAGKSSASIAQVESKPELDLTIAPDDKKDDSSPVRENSEH